MKRFLCGTYEIRIIGAAVERCCSRWAEADLPFWELSRQSEIEASCNIFRRDWENAGLLAERAQCELEICRERGLPLLWKRLRARPVLAAGVLIVLGLTFLLNRFVWFVQIQGNERVSEERIRRVLYEEGVSFGARGDGIDSEYLKNRCLLRIPELRWLAVNREGGLVTVSVAECEAPAPEEETEGICNLVAVRSGIVRQMQVINGFPQVEAGDTVSPGDVLISGVMEWTTHLQLVHAQGEVTASTFREQSLVIPAESVQKRYTGRTETCISIIFQRNRRKISGNSSIFGTMCDTIIDNQQLSLPGAYLLPLRIETLTLREYEAIPEPIPEDDAQRLLTSEAERLIRAEMISGRIENGSSVIQKTENSYLCRAGMNCLELISGVAPVELFGEDEIDGEADQRRTD